MKNPYFFAKNRKRLLFKRLAKIRKDKPACEFSQINKVWIASGYFKEHYKVGYYTFETSTMIDLFEIRIEMHPSDPRLLMAWNLLGMNNPFSRFLSFFK
jgi:hypothetical protein